MARSPKHRFLAAIVIVLAIALGALLWLPGAGGDGAGDPLLSAARAGSAAGDGRVDGESAVQHAVASPPSATLGGAAAEPTSGDGIRTEAGGAAGLPRVRVRCVVEASPIAGAVVLAVRDRAAQQWGPGDMEIETTTTEIRYVPGGSGGARALPARTPERPPVEFDAEGWRSSWGVTDDDGWVELAIPEGAPWMLDVAKLGYFPREDWASGGEHLTGSGPFVVALVPMLALVARPRTSAPITFRQTHEPGDVFGPDGFRFHARHGRALRELQRRFPGCLVSMVIDPDPLPGDTRTLVAHTADGLAWRLTHPLRPYGQWRDPVAMDAFLPEGTGVLSFAIRERATGRILPIGVRVYCEAHNRHVELPPNTRLIAEQGSWKVSAPVELAGPLPDGFPRQIEVLEGQQHHQEIWIDGSWGPIRVDPPSVRHRPDVQLLLQFHSATGARLEQRVWPERLSAAVLWLPVGRWTLLGQALGAKPTEFELRPGLEEPVVLKPQPLDGDG